MKRSFSLWQFAGYAAVSLLGTILHFLYEWTGDSILAAPFSGVNESTWEHMKLLFFPLFLFALIESRFFRDVEKFWCIKLIGTVTGLVRIPVLFYTYNGVFGKSPDFINIIIFFISAAATFLTESYLFKKNSISCRHPRIAFVALCFIGILFVLFTFKTPQIPIFMDPLTGTYGIAS